AEPCLPQSAGGHRYWSRLRSVDPSGRRGRSPATPHLTHWPLVSIFSPGCHSAFERGCRSPPPHPESEWHPQGRPEAKPTTVNLQRLPILRCSGTSPVRSRLAIFLEKREMLSRLFLLSRLRQQQGHAVMR